MFAALTIERVAGAHILEFHCATNVTSRKLTHLFAVSTRANEELCHTFLRTAVGILQIVTFFHHTAHHLEVLNFTDVRFNASLEEIDAGGCVFHWRHCLTARVVHRGHFVYIRHHVAQEFHQATHAHIFSCANAEHGEDAASHHTLADAFTHFVFGELFRFKELLHELFVILSSCFYECFVKQRSAFHFFCWDVFDHRITAFFLPREFFHQNHVDETIESCSRSQGILHGNSLFAVDGLQIIKDRIVVAILVVKLIDEEDNGFVELFRVAEVVLCTYFRTESTIDEEDSRVGHIESGHRCAHKVVRTWAVDDIELLLIPFYVESSGKNGVAIFLFDWEVVGNGIFLGNTTAARESTSMVEHAFCERGFSRTVVAK